MFLLPKLGFLILGFFARLFNIRLLFFSKNSKKITLDGVEFSLEKTKHDASIWTPFKSRFVFKINPEKTWDRFFKYIGLSVEFQTGDKEFDERIYMASDSLSLNKHIASDEELKKLIVELSKLGFKQIVVDGSYFKIKLSKEQNFDNTHLANGVRIYKALLGIEKKWRGNFSDPFAWKYLFTECIVWSIGVYGFISLYAFYFGEWYFYIDIYPLIELGLIYSSAACLFLIFLVFYFFRESSRAHRIILESALVLIAGVPAAATGLLSDLNIYLDQNKTTTIELLIEDKTTYVVSRSRGTGTTTYYYLHLQQKNNYRFYQIPKTLSVPSELYDRAVQGQYLTIEVSPGRYKFPWFKRMQFHPTTSVSSSK